MTLIKNLQFAATISVFPDKKQDSIQCIQQTKQTTNSGVTAQHGNSKKQRKEKKN